MSDLDEYVSARRAREAEFNAGYDRGLADLRRQVAEMATEGAAEIVVRDSLRERLLDSVPQRLRVTITEFKKDPEKIIEIANELHQPIFVTRYGKDYVVVLAKSDWDAMQAELTRLQDRADVKDSPQDLDQAQALERIKDLNESIRKKPLKFQEGYSAERIRELNRGV